MRRGNRTFIANHQKKDIEIQSRVRQRLHLPRGFAAGPGHLTQNRSLCNRASFRGVPDIVALSAQWAWPHGGAETWGSLIGCGHTAGLDAKRRGVGRGARYSLQPIRNLAGLWREAGKLRLCRFGARVAELFCCWLFTNL